MRAFAFLGDALRDYQGAVVDCLNTRGFALEPLVAGELTDLEAIAGGEPALLFLCGLPYARAHDAGLPLEALVAPVSDDAADAPPGYRSLLLGRPEPAPGSIAELDEARLAINARDSMSGWVLPVAFGLPLERFASVTETGAHVRSMEALLAGTADAAPIDSMLLAAERARRPEFARLPVLAAYGPSPSPPVVLTGGDPELAERLRAALRALHEDDDGRRALARGGMARFDVVDNATYDATRTCDRSAAACTR